MNPPNTVKISKSNIKNMGGLPKGATSSLVAQQQTAQAQLHIQQQQSQLLPAQSGRMMVVPPSTQLQSLGHGLNISTPGSFAIIENGQQNDGRSGALKPLGVHMNGPTMDHELVANSSQQMFQIHVPTANQT